MAVLLFGSVLRADMYIDQSMTWIKIFLEYRLTDPVGEVLKGIRCYFDKALPLILLYKKERKQYHETVVGDVSPSTIYGAEHLLRLFGTI